jgi:hypothetical protein
LAQLNNEAINILNRPFPVPGEDFHIRLFTPEAEGLFGFSSPDVGKVLTHLSFSIGIPNSSDGCSM